MCRIWSSNKEKLVEFETFGTKWKIIFFYPHQNFNFYQFLLTRSFNSFYHLHSKKYFESKSYNFLSGNSCFQNNHPCIIQEINPSQHFSSHRSLSFPHSKQYRYNTLECFPSHHITKTTMGDFLHQTLH